MRFYTNHTLDEQTLNEMLSVLAKGDRILIIPVRDGVRIYRIKREEI